jgi:hypothetical protein
LYFQITAGAHKIEATLNELAKNVSLNESQMGGTENKSYLPEIFYTYGRAGTAYQALTQLIDPSLKRREYPEVSYAVIGSVATGLMGLQPDSIKNTIETFPQLTQATEWANLEHIPVFGNQISVRHTGTRKTTLSNDLGPPLHWKASFPSLSAKLIVNGKEQAAQTGKRLSGAPETSSTITVNEGETHTVEYRN